MMASCLGPVSRPFSAQQFREFVTGAEQKQPDAFGFDADDARDVAVRRSLGVSQPEHRALTRPEMRECPREICPPLRFCSDIDGRRQFVVPDRDKVRAKAAATAIVRKVGGDPEEGVAAVRVALVAGTRAEKSIVGFLKEIVCEIRAPGDTGEIRPQCARCPIVQRSEGGLVHLEHCVGGTSLGAKLFDL